MGKTIQQIINAIDNFDFKEEQRKIIIKNSETLAEFQAEQWAKSSQDKDGKPLRLLDNALYGYGYSPLTIKLKKKYGVGVGKITKRITFFKTGELHERLFVTVRKNDIVWGSNVEYFKSLMKRAGNPQGLNEKYKEKFRKEIVETQLEIAFFNIFYKGK